LGFERLEATVRRATVNHSGEAALAAAADAYIAFAQGSPAQFRLMFSRELVDLSQFPAASAAGAAAFAALTSVVASLAPKDQVGDLSLAAWCLVHGYATLCIEANLESGDRRGERARLFGRLICGYTTGEP
jgi:Tetracyclin repressor-like, C-terminal domain